MATGRQPSCRRDPSALGDHRLRARRLYASGLPCFRRYNGAPLCLWAFDLLAIDRVRLLPLPLKDRKALSRPCGRSRHRAHPIFGTFPDPITCEWMGGIVSKRVDSAYRPGPTKNWLKIKTAAWGCRE